MASGLSVAISRPMVPCEGIPEGGDKCILHQSRLASAQMPINWGQSQSEIAEATTIAIKQLNRVVDVFDL
jgi:hypothetical protein